ncbi:MAG: hypothetical protein NT084_03360 [Bacteroidetes bacterium]|nr:hypothetical protein [Bacteroidota bacterium]
MEFKKPNNPLEKTVTLFINNIFMKQSSIIFSILIIVFLVISSCNKPGTDGKATLKVLGQHHGRTIPNITGHLDTVYVKFNAVDLPSDPTHNYDVFFVGVAGQEYTLCPNLHVGDYFLYVAGWDTAINQRTTGGMAVKIKFSDRKKEIETIVAITE